MNDIDTQSAPETVAPRKRHGIPLIGSYPDYANPDLLNAIPLTARTVLDIGCGGGALGMAYRARNPLVRYLGVELDPVAAGVAAERLSEVSTVDVEAEPMPFTVPEGIDCIVYGDVLEHLRDPWALVKAQATHLNADGTVVVCFPNVEHWSIVYRLLKGNFEYEEEGLLDRTHLRWFTPRMMGTALEAAGLSLLDLRPRPHDRASAERFAQSLAPGLTAIGVDPAEFVRRSGPVQFIWRAKKEPRPRIVVNSTMLPPIGGVSDVRVIEPIQALASDSSVIASVSAESELSPILSETPHIAVLHRPLLLGEGGIGRARALIERGFVIVTEFDDHPVFLERKGISADQLLTFTAAHAIQTTTEPLAAALSEYNPEVAVFPNAIAELRPPANFQNPDRMTMFFGALNREDDWAPLMPALNEVLRAVGHRLSINVLHDQRFFDALETPHKNFLPTTDYATYQDQLARAEICFMPLADTLFNRAKSDLKFIEASAARVVSLASPVVYENSIVDGETGLLFCSPDALRMQLLRLLAYPEAARGLADAARAKIAAERMLAYQMRARIDWYHTLWARRDELTAALRARVPALFA